MLSYTGHPLVDVGVATITAFAGKKEPSSLTLADLDKIAAYMERNYIVDPLKSFLTVAFPNSGFTQPAFEKQPKKRKTYAERVLRAYRPGTPTLETLCVFTGKPAVAVPLDVEGKLPHGRAFRQHVPLLTGEGRINFHPYGNAGLPISGEALLAIQALPLGCVKVGGRLLAVHADDMELTYCFARHFLEHNRKAIQTAQVAKEKKLPEPAHRTATLLIETFMRIREEQQEAAKESRPVSITAYHLSNSGQGVALDIYHLPLEITDFLAAAMSARYKPAWDALRSRGWEIAQSKRSKRSKDSEEASPRYNVLYEDLFRLPEEAGRFIRLYFLRTPQQRVRPGDPRTTYSTKSESHLLSWELTELFLRRVIHMNPTRIQQLRNLGDALAEYVNGENDRRFFNRFLTSRRYDDLRATIIRISLARVKKGQPPLVAFDPYIEAFEQGEDLPYSDWRLARDLVLIRVIERLYQLGYLQAHSAELPEPEAAEEEST